jgi:glycosyltransferase involved in cell wall biosynthesis
MRVGFVLDRFPSFYQTFVRAQLDALEALGLDLVVFSLKPPPAQAQPDPRPLRAPVVYAPPLRRIDRLLAGQAAALGRPGQFADGLALGLRADRPAVVTNWLRGTALAPTARRLGVTHLHAHFATGANVAAMVMARLSGVPFSFTSWAVDLYVRPTWFCQTLAESAFHTTASDYNRRHILATCGERFADRVHVVHGGIDPAAFAVPDRVAHEPPLVLSIGRLVEKKGHPDLVAALATVRDRGLPFRAEIIGDGPLRQSLAEAIAANQLVDYVTLSPPADLAAIRQRYAAADLFCLPCVVAADGDRDGIPTVLMEALAAGLPVVSTTVAGIPELVTPSVGRLVDPHNPPALADALTELVTRPDLRRELSAAGPATVRDGFDVAANAAALARLFRSDG